MATGLGLQGYASLMRAQKNPYERNIATTANVMNAMPRDGGASGLEGIGKIPLMYAMGRDTARAQEFDQQQAEQDQGYLSQIMQADKDKTTQEAKDKAMKNYIDLAGKDPEAANQLAEGDPLLKSVLPPGMKLKEKMDKNGWLTAETLSEDGKSKTTYQFNIGGFQIAKQRMVEQGFTGTPTADQLAQAMPQGYAFKLSGAAQPAKEKTDKPQSQVVRDKSSPTGWSYLTEQGNMMQGAPDPTKAKEGAGGGGPTAEQKGFSQWVTKYDGLMKARASIEKGLDPITGQVIPQTQIETAKQTVNDQIAKTERYMQATFPTEWKVYAGSAPSTATKRTVTDAQLQGLLSESRGDKAAVRSTLKSSGYTHYPDGTPIQ